MTKACILIVAFSMVAVPISGQEAGELARKLEKLDAYPDLIVFNGKIATMDRQLTTAQAMAIRDGRIQALGSNAEMKFLAGPKTAMLDGKGRTILPGLIDTHTHPHLWAVLHWLGNGVAASKYDPQLLDTYAKGRNPAEVVQAVEAAVKKRAKELGPGKWIWITLYPDLPEAGLGPKEENLDEAKEVAESLLGKKRLTPEMLDGMAPDNPLVVFVPTATGSNIHNTRAKQVMESVLGRALNSGTASRYTLPYDVILQGKTEAIADLLKLEMSSCLSTKGVTTIGSHIESPATLKALNLLDRRGEMPVRWGWVHRSGYTFARDPAEFYRLLGDFREQGSEYFWNTGAGGEGWEDQRRWACTRAKVLNSSQPRQWGYPPCPDDFDLPSATESSPAYRAMKATLESGLRMTFLHAYADGTYDAVFHMIEEAIRGGKLTLEQVREARIGLEHNMIIRPDQIDKLAKYGIMLSFQGFQLDSSEKGGAFLKDYGEQYMKWMMPVKSAIDAGVRVLFGTDHHLTKTNVEAKALTGVPVSWEDSIWPYYEFFITRRIGGKIFTGQEAVDRVTVLRGATTWAAENLFREKDLGSLEAGKLADFIVIDRDYFTIPETEIGKIKTLLTVLGGKTVYRSPEF